MPPITEIIYLILAFIVWIAVTFGFHFAVVIFIDLWRQVIVKYVFVAPIITTVVQCMCCVLFFDISSILSHGNNKSVITVVKICGHVIGTFFTNLSLVFLEASSVMSIKMMEPITAAIAQRIFQNVKIHWISIVSLPVVVYGALQFNFEEGFVFNPGVGIAFLSNILMNARSIAISFEQKQKAELRLREVQIIILVVFSMLVVMILSVLLELKDMLPSSSSNMVFSAVTCGVLNVACGYINAYVMLKRVSVLTHSLLNNVKRMSVVLLLYTVGERIASTFNFLGLVICGVGLSLNQVGKYYSKKSAAKTNVEKEDVDKLPEDEPENEKILSENCN